MAEAISKPATMSRREWLVVFLLVFSVVVNYIDRSNLSLAVPMLEKQFSISPYQAGELLAAFSWTYALAQLFGLSGWLADRFHAGWVLLIGYLLWSMATAATGLVTGFTALFLLRLLLGLAESVAYPCYSRIFVAMPQQYRGRANALIDAGTKMGPAAGAFVGGIVLINFGWRWLFGIFGLGALVWLPIWYWAMPKEMPVAAHGAEPAKNDGKARTADPSTLSILRLPAAWGSIIGQFCGNYFYYFLLAWLPSYLMQEEKFSIPEMSKLTSGVFFLIACTTLVCGYVSDIWIASGSSPSVVRRTFSAGGLVLASLLIPFSLVRGHWSLVLLGLASMGQGAYASNHWAITQTLAGPKMAGRWSSLQNGFANFAGVAAPWLSGFIIQRFGSARLAFTVAGIVAGTGGVLFGLLVRRVEVVDWDALASGGRAS